jgi:hypothetical protein
MYAHKDLPDMKPVREHRPHFLRFGEGNSMATLELKLAENTIVFVDVKPSRDGRLREVADDKLQANFEKVSRSIRAIAESIDAQLESLIRRPDEMTIEMGAELKGEADLWIVTGEATGHIKVKMTWSRAAK